MSLLCHDKHATEGSEGLPQVETRSADLTNWVVKLSSTPPMMLRWPLVENSLTFWNSCYIKTMRYSPRFSQKSEQLMEKESRTSGELLLPVSRRPSHRDVLSQRNDGAPSRISNRTSPWWFTWQTVALVLYSWIPTHIMP